MKSEQYYLNTYPVLPLLSPAPRRAPPLFKTLSRRPLLLLRAEKSLLLSAPVELSPSVIAVLNLVTAFFSNMTWK